jgi:hypothetical protein
MEKNYLLKNLKNILRPNIFFKNSDKIKFKDRLFFLFIYSASFLLFYLVEIYLHIKKNDITSGVYPFTQIYYSFSIWIFFSFVLIFLFIYLGFFILSLILSSIVKLIKKNLKFDLIWSMVILSLILIPIWQFIELLFYSFGINLQSSFVILFYLVIIWLIWKGVSLSQ